MPKIAAFLRGINLNGKTVKMAELKTVLEKLKLKNVKTLLASGNVVFESDESMANLKPLIENALEKHWGWHIHVILRNLTELKKLADSEPFKGIPVTKATRLYVTFLSTAPKKHPHCESPDGNFKILRATDTEVCSVLTVVEGTRSVDLMAVLEKEYGKEVTTRNWNTVEKILKA